MPFAHESDDVCLCQDGFLLRQKIHFAMAAACGFGTCVLDVSVDLESVNFSFPGAPYVSIVL